MNFLEIVKQYWPFMALGLWFAYKWWNSKRVIAMLPELKKMAPCLSMFDRLVNLHPEVRQAPSTFRCLSWGAGSVKYPGHPPLFSAAPAERAVEWPSCC
jgi:hypothetical protein